MSMFNDLLKRTFELWVKKHWLKEIKRAEDRYRKAKTKATYEHYVLTTLIKEYNNIYNDNLWRDNSGRVD